MEMQSESHCKITRQNHRLQLLVRIARQSHDRESWGGKCRTELQGQKRRVALMCGIVRQNCGAESQDRIAGQNCKAESQKRVMGVGSVGQNCGAKITG